MNQELAAASFTVRTGDGFLLRRLQRLVELSRFRERLARAHKDSLLSDLDIRRRRASGPEVTLDEAVENVGDSFVSQSPNNADLGFRHTSDAHEAGVAPSDAARTHAPQATGTRMAQPKSTSGANSSEAITPESDVSNAAASTMNAPNQPIFGKLRPGIKADHGRAVSGLGFTYYYNQKDEAT